MTSARCVAWATMMANTDVFSGYLLHSRPFRDSSVICDFFLRHVGRVSILYKGVKKSGKPGAKARLLQPFSPLSVSYTGRGELKSGLLLEANGAGTFLQGKRLYSGLYLNELLMRLLHKEEPHDELFEYYQSALKLLLMDEFEVVLRRFEQQLLMALGYELVFEVDDQGNEVQAGRWYVYEYDSGFVPLAAPSQDSKIQQRSFLGAHLLAIHQHVYDDADILKSAKRLSRLALAPHLGDKPLKSRELFKQVSAFP